MRLIVHTTGRTGSSRIHHLLEALGIRAGHDAFIGQKAYDTWCKDGDFSPSWPGLLEVEITDFGVPWFGREAQITEDYPPNLAYLVRSCPDYVNSFMSNAEWTRKFYWLDQAKRLGMNLGDSPNADEVAMYWLHFSQAVEKLLGEEATAKVFRIEDFQADAWDRGVGALIRLAALTGGDINDTAALRALSTLPENVNHRNPLRYKLGWKDMPGMVRVYAERWYPEAA